MKKLLITSITALIIGSSLLPCVPANASSMQYTNNSNIPVISRHTTRHPVPAGYKGYVYCTGNNVNIRNGNGTIRGKLMCGNRIYIQGLVNGQGWYYLNGEKVYIAGQYLSTQWEKC